MEKKKKKKDHKFASTNSQEVIETKNLLNKEDQNQTGAAAKNTSGSSSNENATPSNHQFQPVFHWTNTTQSEMDNAPLTSKPFILNQSTSPIIPSRWHQTHHLQPNPTIHQDQFWQPPPHLAQPPVPFWLAQDQAQQNGYQLPGDNEHAAYPQYGTPVGTTDVTWQVPSINDGKFLAKGLAQAPSFSYHVGYPYPGFPGPWDPSSWWAQPQQSVVPPYPYTLTGPCGYFPSQPPPVPTCSAAPLPSFQRGIMQAPAKLSHKHQKLWEAQSAENVQLWNVISHLQSELEDHKTRLTKLEAEITSLKPTVEEPPSLAGKKPKRGRPKRPTPSNNDTLLSPDKPRSQARGPMPPHTARTKTKLNFEKESGKKVEDRAKTIEITNSSNPLIHSQVVGVCLENESKVEENKVEDSKTSYVNGNFAWPSNIYPVECGRNLINIVSPQSFYSDVNGSGLGRKVGVSEWSFGNGENASLGVENAALESGKDEEDEEIEEDGSSGNEDTL